MTVSVLEVDVQKYDLDTATGIIYVNLSKEVKETIREAEQNPPRQIPTHMVTLCMRDRSKKETEGFKDTLFGFVRGRFPVVYGEKPYGQQFYKIGNTYVAIYEINMGAYRPAPGGENKRFIEVLFESYKEMLTMFTDDIALSVHLQGGIGSEKYQKDAITHVAKFIKERAKSAMPKPKQKPSQDIELIISSDTPTKIDISEQMRETIRDILDSDNLRDPYI